jgi:hypothetical protein
MDEQVVVIDLDPWLAKIRKATVTRITRLENELRSVQKLVLSQQAVIERLVAQLSPDSIPKVN